MDVEFLYTKHWFKKMNEYGTKIHNIRRILQTIRNRCIWNGLWPFYHSQNLRVNEFLMQIMSLEACIANRRGWHRERSRSAKLIMNLFRYPTAALQWRHNDHDCVSNHQPRGCLLNRIFRRRSKKTSKLRVTGLCAGNSPDQWIPRTKGQLRGKCFHLMTSSWLQIQWKNVNRSVLEK